MADDDAPLTPKEIEHFRSLLEDKHREVAGDIERLERELAEATQTRTSGESRLQTHPADAATDQYDQDLSIRLLAGQRDLLREVDDALERIDKGAYGICQGTGKPIQRKRLQARPWARYGIEYERQRERP